MAVGYDMRDKVNIRRELTRDSVEPATYLMFGDETIYVWVSNVRETTLDLNDDILIWNHPAHGQWNQYKWAGDNPHSRVVTAVWNKDNHWEELVYNTLFLDSDNTTADFDTTNHNIAVVVEKGLIPNNSFEEYNGQDDFPDWSVTKNTQNDSGAKFTQESDWVTDGSYSCYGHMGYAATYSGTQEAYISQTIDFTGYNYLVFDSKTERVEHGEVDVYIDSDKVWSTTTGYTEYLNQSIDINSYTGSHELKLYHTCSGNVLKYASGRWDNIILENILPTGSYISREVYKGTSDIHSATITATETKPGNSTIEWYASTDGGSTWTSMELGVEKVLPSGKELKIKAELTVDGTDNPTTTDINVDYTFA